MSELDTDAGKEAMKDWEMNMGPYIKHSNIVVYKEIFVEKQKSKDKRDS